MDAMDRLRARSLNVMITDHNAIVTSPTYFDRDKFILFILDEETRSFLLERFFVQFANHSSQMFTFSRLKSKLYARLRL